MTKKLSTYEQLKLDVKKHDEWKKANPFEAHVEEKEGDLVLLKDDIKWLKMITPEIKKISTHDVIYVTDMCCLDENCDDEECTGKASYLDVSIGVLNSDNKYIFRWIFTVTTKDLTEKEEKWNKEVYEKNGWEYTPNSKLDSFDNIDVDDKNLGVEELIKYSEEWFRKWFPNWKGSAKYIDFEDIIDGDDDGLELPIERTKDV